MRIEHKNTNGPGFVAKAAVFSKRWRWTLKERPPFAHAASRRSRTVQMLPVMPAAIAGVILSDLWTRQKLWKPNHSATIAQWLWLCGEGTQMGNEADQKIAKRGLSNLGNNIDGNSIVENTRAARIQPQSGR